jgi:hypothetical protein
LKELVADAIARHEQIAATIERAAELGPDAASAQGEADVLVPCVWEYKTPLPLRNNGAEATLFWKSDPLLDTPDVQSLLAEGPVFTPKTAHFLPPAASCSIFAAVVRPRSRGHLCITGTLLHGSAGLSVLGWVA